MSHASPGRRLPVVTHRAPLLALVLLAACAAPAVCGGCGDPTDPADVLPASFRVEAEIVSVEGVAPQRCTPTSGDISANGPDWWLRFDRMLDATEPTFSETTTSRVHDGAAECLASGETDCCRPLADAEGGGWTLECDGRPGLFGRSHFAFTFDVDGSGSAVSTVVQEDVTRCTVTSAWTAILPL